MSREDMSTVCKFCKTTTEFGLFCRASIVNGGVFGYQEDLINALAMGAMDMHSISRLLKLGVSAGQMSYHLVDVLEQMDINTLCRLLESGVSLQAICFDAFVMGGYVDWL
jgi:hypothetical protein